MATRASNSGAIPSSPIHSGKSRRKPAAIKKRFSSSNAIRKRAKKRAAIGPFSAIAALTRISPSSTAGSANDSAIFANPVFSRISHALRMGAARRNLARLAARTDRLARKVRADPVGFRRNRASHHSRRTRFPFRRKSRRRIACPRHPQEISRRPRQRNVLPRSHRSRLDARFRPDLRQELRRQRRIQQFLLQRLGQILQSQKRRTNRGARQQIPQEATLSPPSQRPPRRARRRLDRRQRRRHAPHHGRMSAEQNSGTQSGFHKSRLRRSFSQSVRRVPRHLAQKRHCRRRHARPRRRSQPFRKRNHRSHNRRRK